MNNTQSSIHSVITGDDGLEGTNQIEDNNIRRKRARERDEAGNPRAKRQCLSPDAQVLQILQSTATGKNLIDEYKQSQLLSSRSSIKLCNLIIEHVVVNNTVRLKKDDFLQLREQIIEIFPNEDPDVYYSVPVSKFLSPLRVTERAKGRLYERYRNVLKTHRLLEKCNTATGDTEIEYEGIPIHISQRFIAMDNKSALKYSYSYNITIYIFLLLFTVSR